MKQKIYTFAIILWAGVASLSCKSEPEPEPEPEPVTEPEAITLDVSVLEHRFEAKQKLSLPVTVKSNRSFEANSSQTWCVTEIIEENETDNLIITVSENKSIDERSATVAIATQSESEDEESKTSLIKITQSGTEPSLALEEGAIYIAGKGEGFTVHVKANFPIVFTFPAWIEPQAPENDSIYTFVARELPASTGTRKGNLVAKAVNPEITNAVSIPVVQTNNPSLNVMTYNIYVESGSLLRWYDRRYAMVQFIRLNDPDIIGTQETEYSQHTFLQRNLTEYALYGVGREDGKTNGEHNTILYKKGRFTEHGSGTFWLNENPDKPGKGWDAGYTRIASWLILKDKISGKQLFVINTHIDHKGPTAQKESIPLLMSKISKLHGELPVVLTGDFNMPPTNNNIRYITDASEGHYSLLHTKKISETPPTGNVGTYHALEDADSGKDGLIDYIFVDEKVRVLAYTVFPPKFEGSFLSDHSAVMAKIEIRE
jgi:endonuclease/exonuclease/phosphatase family metal-dependent hydrolase